MNPTPSMANRTMMQRPQSRIDRVGFFARVRSAPARVLALDYDGTLAPFCLSPTQAVPYPGVVAILDAIMDSARTRVVIASGRWIKDLVPLLGLKRLPELWGCHGWEGLYPSGDYHSPAIGSDTLERLSATRDWTTEIESFGARAERKPAGIAFHWRGLSDDRIAHIRTQVLENWETMAQCDDFAWHDFDGGIELRVAGRDKGDVVRTLTSECGPDSAIAYLGDDRTDEDAFMAIPRDGAAVLVRRQFRPTVADLWIRPPEELLEFLIHWREASAHESP